MNISVPEDYLPPEICNLLYDLGLTPNYTGFFHTAYAAYLALQSPQRLRLVTKWLYPEVAEHYQTTPSAVERNIRLAVSHIWDRNPKLLCSISSVPLISKPSSSKFIAILYSYMSHLSSL